MSTHIRTARLAALATSFLLAGTALAQDEAKEEAAPATTQPPQPPAYPYPYPAYPYPYPPQQPAQPQQPTPPQQPAYPYPYPPQGYAPPAQAPAPAAEEDPLLPSCVPVRLGTPKELTKILRELHDEGYRDFDVVGGSVVCAW